MGVMSNQDSSGDGQVSADDRHPRPILRVLSLVALAVAVLLIGHFLLWLGLAVSCATRVPLLGNRYAPDVPAPPGAGEPLVSAVAPGGKVVILSYSSRESASDVIRFYEKAMPARGWTKRAEERRAELGHPGISLSYSNPQGNSCIISISEPPGGGTRAVVLRRIEPTGAVRGPAQEED